MAPKSRVDVWNKGEYGLKWRGLAATGPTPSNLQSAHLSSAQGTQSLTNSTGHPFHRLGKTRANIGGDFSCTRRIYGENSPWFHNRTVVGDGNVNASNYTGRYYAAEPNIANQHFPLIPYASDDELDVYGTRGIALALPTNPIGGLATALGELRSEGIPNLVGVNTWRDRTLKARNAGSEYLNYQFGWLPLVNELLTFADTVRRSDEIVQKYEEEEGKLLHRKITFPTSLNITSSTDSGYYPKPTLEVGFWNSAGSLNTVTTEKVEMWFEGTFMYKLPPKGSLGRHLAIANKLYGTRLTPEVVWNLTPWTWALDWFTNVGDVVHNLTAFQNDGLVMPYAYIMRRRTISRQFTAYGARTRRDNRSVNCSQSLTTVVKQRKMATPYGFGLTFDGFSDRQLAILGALGLTRGRKPKYG